MPQALSSTSWIRRLSIVKRERCQLPSTTANGRVEELCNSSWARGLRHEEMRWPRISERIILPLPGRTAAIRVNGGRCQTKGSYQATPRMVRLTMRTSELADRRDDCGGQSALERILPSLRQTPSQENHLSNRHDGLQVARSDRRERSRMFVVRRKPPLNCIKPGRGALHLKAPFN